ncbi:MAG: host specificity protein, partial [Gemmobacter sp.]|nr:host specificity protein [Gemmobacter sp.]
VVLIDGTLAQLDLPIGLRGLERHYRVGVAARGTDHATVQHSQRAFAGVGLRPYAPAHLRARTVSGDLHFDWIRRSRIDGDSWQSTEVPLGEEGEAYLVQLRQGTAILREAVVREPGWIYSAAMRGEDGLSGRAHLAVAQISASFGPGPAAFLELDT